MIVVVVVIVVSVCSVVVTVSVTAAAGGPVMVHGGAFTVMVLVTVGFVEVTVLVLSVMGTKEEQNDDALRATKTALQSSTTPRFSRTSLSGAGAARAAPRRRRVENKVLIGAMLIVLSLIWLGKIVGAYSERASIADVVVLNIPSFKALGGVPSAGLSQTATVQNVFSGSHLLSSQETRVNGPASRLSSQLEVYKTTTRSGLISLGRDKQHSARIVKYQSRTLEVHIFGDEPL